ncbi:MAG: putative CoA-binding protein [Verrucomicrobiales bacterium]|jgi:predicted CoA-binding protein
MNVAILGATDKPDRFAHKAQKLLMEHGHVAFPISLSGKEILGCPGYRSIVDITEEIDTVTVYMNPDRFAVVQDEILAKAPRRIIFNPGTESPEAAKVFREAGISVVEACTLILLDAGQFESA